MLESMASGVPAVAAKAGGIPNLIADGKTGLLFSPGDVGDLVGKVVVVVAALVVVLAVVVVAALVVVLAVVVVAAGVAFRSSACSPTTTVGA